jgi:hypothetical protein
MTSAERSKAREDGVSRVETFRVASPLVMAKRAFSTDSPVVIEMSSVLATQATTSCFAGG